jgi:hypothetical protein
LIDLVPDGLNLISNPEELGLFCFKLLLSDGEFLIAFAQSFALFEEIF